MDRLKTSPWFGAAGISLVFLAAGTARADRIFLKGGAQLRGVVVPSPGHPELVVIQTESLTTPLRYRKDQVLQVTPDDSPLKEYLIKRDKTAKTAEAQYELGLWCEQEKLPAYAELQFRKAVEADDTFAAAHQKLGHVLHEGRWITNDELRTSQGLVKVKGKWMSKEEKAKFDEEKAVTGAQAAWRARLRVLRNALLEAGPEKRQAAQSQLAAIRDPVAVTPLVKTFSEDADALRTLLVRILGGIPGAEASQALVNRLLAETESGARQAALEELSHRNDSNIVPLLIRSLKSRDLAQVNRAAWALGNLNAVSAVPKLVPVLVIEDQKMVWVPTETPVAESSGGTFFSGTSVPYAMLNSVAVGPGAVGFGASAYPLYTGTGISYGGGGGTAPSLQPRIVSNMYRNAEVLGALERLTGQHFGFDLAAWRRWVNTSFRPEPEPARQVPQP
ncbi:MAG TPA: HEAT repeat domain-containing protein [Isosphaeraceae bacterium]|nr:HEAT repeat domain-containing protein [Isosphaeraceae bacterium]